MAGRSDADAPRPPDRPHRPDRRWRRPLGSYVLAGAIYQCLSLAVWWRLLAGGVTTTLPSGSADPGQEVWFLGWFEHALATGANPFVSHALFAPAGVNLLSNTSCDLIGLLFAPVTATAGPVAAFDVATLLAPTLSALGAFALCRRYVDRRPAAFAGGLLFGFGPFLATDLRYGHLDLTWLALPPLIWCCVDELLLRRTARPGRVGALLGLAVAAQFFISTEILAITALTVLAALVLAAAARPRRVVPSLRAAWPGLAALAVVAGGLLAYPLWLVVAGPRHVSGPVWPHIGAIATSFAAIVQPHAELAGVAFVSGGDGGYLGVALLVVLVAGGWWCRHRDAVRLAAGTGVVALVASLGYRLHLHDASTGVPLPDALLRHLPLLDSVVPARFGAAVDLCAAVVLAVVAQRVLASASSARVPAGAWCAGLCALALLPLVVVDRWPYPVRRVDRPPPAAVAALARRPAAAPGRPPVVVVYPDASGAVAAQMVVQAEDGFAFSLADGYAIVPGPDGRTVESPPVDALWLVLAAGSVGTLDGPLTPTTVRSVRSSLRDLDVATVEVLPGAPGSRAVRRAMTQVLGPPRYVAGVALWRTGR